MKLTRSIGVGMGLLLTVSLAHAGNPVIKQDRKLLASDSAAEDFFGFSVAISDGIVAVGSYRDDDNGTDSGAVYLYNASTGSQLFKLVPSDGSSNDIFGWSVAIDNGIVAVGARGDGDNGPQSGSAYLFNASTGMQIRKIVPSDGSGGDFFGNSIAIDNGVVAIGAFHDDPHGNNSGSAYLFNASTGGLISKLTAGDGGIQDVFGHAIGIRDGVVAVGAYAHRLDGVATGAAYLFSATTGIQFAKLLPDTLDHNDAFGFSIAVDGNIVAVGARSDDDGGLFSSGAVHLFDATTALPISIITADDADSADQFGWSVSIDNGIVAVGAHTDNDNGLNSGSAYIFDASTGNQIAKLISNDGLAGDFFGESIGISNGVVAVGAYFHDDDGSMPRGGGGPTTDFGAAYVFFDADADGLTNIWEIIGVPYTKTDGSTGRYILDYDNDGIKDSNPNHKDLFVEIDMMEDLVFSDQAVIDLEDAFCFAPVNNPDDIIGINLYLQIDENTIQFQENFNFPNSGWPDEIVTIKDDFFGTSDEHNGTNEDQAAILAAKGKAYRYCVLVNKILKANGKRIGGRAELPGDDLVMAYSSGSDDWISATFMHEFGHNLNLKHGGIDHINMKPNYPSIMNYVFADPHPWSRTFWQLDYSREKLDPLNEDFLEEQNSVGDGGSGHYDGYKMPYYSIISDGAECFDAAQWGQPFVSYASLDRAEFGVDFNLDCDTDDLFVEADVNYLQSSGLPGTGTTSAGQILIGQNDWENLKLPIPAGGSNFGDAPAEDELTMEGREFIRDNFPIPPGICMADMNGDGMLNFFDVSEFLSLFGLNDFHADFVFDGQYNFFDVSAFLNAYAEGCP